MAYTLNVTLDKVDKLINNGEDRLTSVFYNRVKYGDIHIDQSDLKTLQEMELLSELGKPLNSASDDDAVRAYMKARLGVEPSPPN